MYRKYNKYGNHKFVAEGVEWDSQKEYARWKELQLLERGKVIKNLKRQVEFELLPKQVERIERYSKKTGKRLKDKEVVLEQNCCYVADFVYTEVGTGKTIVEDAKGMKTDVYRIKKKLMLYQYGIRILED